MLCSACPPLRAKNSGAVHLSGRIFVSRTSEFCCNLLEWRQLSSHKTGGKMHLRKRNLPLIVAAIITIGCITVSAQTLTTLHSFNGGDGRSPEAALVQGSDGNFYGTTASGGAFFQGTVFRMTPSGAITVLHSFNSFFSEGAVPFAGLVQGSDGNFYGTTAFGGAHFKGTVFKINATGNLTTLHSFSGSPSEGASPIAALVQGSDGNFYGTTASGGQHCQGTVFRITPAAGITDLPSFSGSPREGGVPFAGLGQGRD